MFSLNCPSGESGGMLRRSIRFQFTVITALSLLWYGSPAPAALIPPVFIDSVVAVGSVSNGPNNQSVFVPEASGFFYGYLVQNDTDPQKRGYQVFLVTNKHVVDPHLQSHIPLSVRLNPKTVSEQGRLIPLPLVTPNGASACYENPDPAVDVAICPMDWSYIQENGIEANFFPSDQTAATVSTLKDLGVSAGDGIFILGFPMGLAGQQRNYVVVRHGCIARISDLLESAGTTLLIDAHVFPGNSGGPAVLEPTVNAIQGTKLNNRAYLLGMVRDYLPYTDVAVSMQTHRPRVTFEENSGLAEVIPVDAIDQTIRNWQASRR